MKVLSFLLFILIQLNAHQSGLSYLEITEKTPQNISITYKKPLADSNAKDLDILYPHNCRASQIDQKSIRDGFIIKKYTLSCEKNGLLGKKIWVEGLDRQDRGMLLLYKNENFTQHALFLASSPSVSIQKALSSINLFKKYFELGLVHILKGYDHLMFVFLLLLLSVSPKKLFIAITAFTLSHSLTLAFSIFGIISLPTLFVEAMIALSIIFLAREMLLVQPNSFTRRHLAFVSFSFGLLHGFGFSSVLSSLGLPQSEIPLSLFAFNLGIEVGQVVFVLFMFVVLKILQKYLSKYEKKILQGGVYFIGVYAAYLFLQRVL